jgi:hypothetical protein
LSTRAQLDDYLAQARRRLRAVLWSRGAAALCLLLLIVTVLAAAILGSSGFSSAVVLVARVLLAAIAMTCGLVIWRATRALTGAAGAAALERALPAQEGRIQTYLQERRKAEQGATPVLLDLLAEDASQIAAHTALGKAIPARRVLVPGALAALAIAGLAASLFLTGSLGSGARRLWLGTLPPAAQLAAAAGGIAVKPGDVAVRRNQDLAIAAVVAGSGGAVQVHMQFAGTGTWEVAPMEPDGKGGHAFTLFAVREAARYYVTAGRLRSAEYGIRVVDLPQIESLRLTYNYPGWTGLPRRTEESGGDIRAVAGTRVALEVVTNAPLEGPLLVINGTQSRLESGGPGADANKVRGDLVVKEPGHYRIATKFGDEIVALTQDLAIDVVPDEKPTVQILRPGRDYQATNIEEVPVSLKAQDDFRLEALTLRYSVNGGDFRDEKLDAGVADIQAAALLRLEELQQKGAGGAAPLLEPGDLVSYYAVARDHASSTQTDLFLIQVQPFDRRFTQSQANGGGGGGGGEDDQGAISERQREVLLATWNLQRTDRAEGRDAERLADNARMLAEVQKTLADQANTLVERARARQLTGTDQGVDKFVTSLEEATKVMRPASEQLARQDLQAAVKNEQLALQHLLRAEATFREIQVAMQSSRGGGGGGAQAGRDVSEMTELELDLEKNQYETEPQMTAQQKSGAENELMQRLKELARRQEQLAREAARRNATPEAQRWQQEQLRREAEQLRRELEQLAQQQSGSRQGGPQGQQSQGQQSQGQNAAAQAAQQVAQALRDMQQQNSAGAANRASEQLNRAREQLQRGQQQAAGEQFDNLARNARELGEKQQRSEEELRAALGGPRPPPSIANPRAPQGPGLGYEQAERLANTKRDIQSGLEALQRQMQAARTQGRERAPNASQQVGEAAKELEDSNTTARLARSAQEIERGRGVQAATREGLITESLQQLQQRLEQAASVAATESGGRNGQENRAEPGDLLAELGELRRALERARQAAQDQQGLAQGNRGGDPGAQSPDAREGQSGQQGGQTGQGQGGQGQANAGGQAGQPGQRGANGARAGGTGNAGVWGGGVYAGGAPRGAWGDIRPDLRAGSDRLQQLRGELLPGAIPDAEIAALKELAERMRRAGTDPMSAEYQKMVALVNQIELAALKSARAASTDAPTRATEVVDDSGRYRDNVADYYRRLGQTND